MTLWLAAAALTAAIVLLLLWPRTRAGDDESAGGHDLAVYRDQLAEVERDAERGLIDARQAEAARTEISRRMLDAAGRQDGAPGGTRSSGRWLRLAVAALLPLAALALYLPSGRPDLPSQPFASRDQSGQEALMAALREAEALAARLAESPEDAAGWVELGQRYRELGRPNEAIPAFVRAIGLTGGDPIVTGFYAEALLEAANGIVTEDAVRAFESVLERLPGDPRARYYLALARAQAGDDAGALQRWQELAADSPAGAPWLVSTHAQIRGTAERLGLDPDEAVPEPLAADAAPRGPSAADVAAAQSMTPEEQSEMIRGMVDGLAQRLEDNPDDLTGWIRLGAAYRVLGQAEDAAAALSRAAELAPNDPEVLAAYGDALLDTASGRELSPEFISVMERLLALDPNDTRALWFLGARALADNRPAEAEALWRRLLDQLEPGTEAYQTVREFLASVSPEEP